MADRTPPVVLSIAGYDPSSGAGVTADVKTAAAHGCFAATCITALTVQSTSGVKRISALAPDLVAQTLEEIGADLPIAAVRIGMLANRHVGMAVAGYLERRKPPHVVVDPIIHSSSGMELLDGPGQDMVKNVLLPLAEVITPNVDEAAFLSGVPIKGVPDLKIAAEKLREKGPKAVVITGGHLEKPVDLLVTETGEVHQYAADKIESACTHGTGCAFATALACNLALGRELPEAVRRAQEYVQRAIREAYPLGHGTGPINHLCDL